MKLSSIIQNINKLFLVFTVVFFFSSCTKFVKTKEEVAVTETAPDMEFDTFHHKIYYEDVMQAEVFATNTKIFRNIHNMELYGTYGYMYDNDIVTSSVKADKAVINEQTLFIKLYTNVILVSSNETKLYTDYIEWDNEKRSFHTTNPVRIERPDGSWLTGIGMESDMGLENITVYNEEDQGYAQSLPMR